jgi:putative tryptophan/tyrosine transport system substrate-binding protein
MNRRDTVLALLALGPASMPLESFAQQQGKVWRVGFLAVDSRQSMLDSGRYDAFLRGMRDLGYVEGKNLAMEVRFADGKPESLSGLAIDLVQSKVDVIVTAGSVAARAAKQATTSIPVVMGAASDPVSSGLVASLARPGGNITGLSLNAIDVSPKHIELVKSVMPKIGHVAVLTNPGVPAHLAILKNLQAAAQRVGIKILSVDARTADEIERGFSTIKREGAEAVIVVIDSFFTFQRQQIAELAARNRLPSVFAFRQAVEAGGLLSYGQDLADSYRRAAGYVDRIFKGAKPGDLPVEQPTKLELVINMKTAKALGITIPQSILLRADRVIE